MHARPLSLFIIENHPLMREALCAAIDAEPDMRVVGAGGREILGQLLVHTGVELILIDLDNGDEDGLALLPVVRKVSPQARIVALINGELDVLGAEARGAGAHNTLTKTAPRHELVRTIRQTHLAAGKSVMQ